jgi:pyrimidine operon attenuation protein / uracil phosphoribosyltransferase
VAERERRLTPPRGGVFVPRVQVLAPEDVQRAITRIAHEIVERNHGLDAVVLVGLQKGGTWLARALADTLEAVEGRRPPVGDLDVSFHRDDVGLRAVRPGVSSMPGDITGSTVVLVDDVLFTGRTVRAAIEALFAYGRPQRVQLAVLADRGHRELPIRPDYVGKNLPTSGDERVYVRLRELDGVDEVAIVLGPHGGAGSASSLARVHSTPRSLRPGPACPATPGRRVA